MYFPDFFLKEKALVSPDLTELNKHAIKLQDGKQPFYEPIYRLRLVELKILKIYIKINLANSFIWPSRSSPYTPIYFVQKPDGSLWLCVDYRSLNNFIIKNQYPLSLISESLNRLGRAKRFTQLDLTSTYYQMQIKEDDK